MSSRGPYRRHSAQFKLQLCHDIRSGVLGRRDALRKFTLSANLIQMWLTQFDRGELSSEEVARRLLWSITKRDRSLGARSASSRWSLSSSKKRHACARERQRKLLHRHRSEACSIRRGCEVIGLPRSTFYCRTSEAGDTLCDLQVVHLIESIQDELPGYGSRRVTHELRRRGHLINHKRIARLMKMHGLGIKPRRRFVRTTDSSHAPRSSPTFIAK